MIPLHSSHPMLAAQMHQTLNTGINLNKISAGSNRISKFKNDPSLIWHAGITEKELADLNGLYRIWDAGKTKWKKRIK